MVELVTESVTCNMSCNTVTRLDSMSYIGITVVSSLGYVKCNNI
jgi:hypothetical protein